LEEIFEGEFELISEGKLELEMNGLFDDWSEGILDVECGWMIGRLLGDDSKLSDGLNDGS